ncbi:MAG TPA: 30S ribosomal protein S18 [Rhodospirillaceae bacterium]|nr:30S ribosomal protein S18 [Rhodospirillaceae bacterium]
MAFAQKKFDRKDRDDRSSSSEGGEEQAARPRRPRGRKRCPFTGPNAPKIDYKDIRTLARYLSERGKIMPARLSGISAKNQRKLAIAIKRARFLALMPYVGDARRAVNQNVQTTTTAA